MALQVKLCLFPLEALYLLFTRIEFLVAMKERPNVRNNPRSILLLQLHMIVVAVDGSFPRLYSVVLDAEGTGHIINSEPFRRNEQE